MTRRTDMTGDDRGLRHVRWIDLLVVVVALGVLGYFVVRADYDALPTLSFVLPAPLAALAVLEFTAARRVRAAVRHDPRFKAMTAIAIARCVALGKASAYVGAGVAGLSGGLLIRLAPQVTTITASVRDVQVGAVLLVVALVLGLAGILLERAGTDPNRGRRRDSGDR